MTYIAIDNSQSVIQHYGKKGMKWRKKLNPELGDGVGLDQYEQALQTNDMAIQRNTTELLKNRFKQVAWEFNKKSHYDKYVKESKKAGEKPMSYKDMVNMARSSHKAANNEYRNRINQHVKYRNIMTKGTGGRI